MSNKITNILDKYPSYAATIGIEVHVQLKTATKIFCSCPNKFGQEPNSNICPVCTGLPGSLPVLNKKAVDFAILAGLATNCTIAEESEFDRKHYMYPDLPKNYQITQDAKPVCEHGSLMIQLSDNTEKKIGITRMHMEEDAGKNIHASATTSWVDLNRAGSPLLEIVSEPDLENAEQAKAYLTKLHTTVRYLDISDANMDEGSFRADINISVKKKDAQELGTRVEVKNMNSIKFITQAINYEIERQIQTLEEGETFTQQTRLWDSKNNKTIFMRTKESGDDYRYFNEPDLPVLIIDKNWVDKLRKHVPELPDQKLKRLQNDYGLSLYEAEIFMINRKLADFLEQTMKHCKNAKTASNVILRDVLKFLKDEKITLAESNITPEHLGELVNALDKGTINSKVGQEVFASMASDGTSPNKFIEDNDLKQIDSADQIEPIIAKIIADNPDNVAKYKGGNERVLPFFVGQVMKATKGKANPKVINELLKKHLS